MVHMNELHDTATRINNHLFIDGDGIFSIVDMDEQNFLAAVQNVVHLVLQAPEES